MTAVAGRLVLGVLLLGGGPAAAQEGDKFLWSQVRYDGDWDPRPGAEQEVLRFLGTVTSVLSVPQRRVVDWKDPALFASPFLLLTGRQAPPSLDEEDLRRLRAYLTAGGFLWIEDASGQKASAFDRWTRRTLRLVFPDEGLTPLGPDHVLFRTFFLLRSIGGRVAVSPSVDGLQWGGRSVVVYSRNDLLGAWAKDALGQPLYECVPGGEPQRWSAKKLTLNIVMYALTGNYKGDAVHQPYLLQKMRSGAP